MKSWRRIRTWFISSSSTTEKNKKFLAAHRGDDAIIEKMLNRAATTNNYFASMFSRVSKLFSPKIPRPQNDMWNLFDIFDKFK